MEPITAIFFILLIVAIVLAAKMVEQENKDLDKKVQNLEKEIETIKKILKY